MSPNKSQSKLEYAAFYTELGYVAFCKSGAGICRLAFGQPTQAKAEAEISKFANERGLNLSKRLKQDPLIRRVVDFSQGDFDSFDDVDIDLSGMTPFNVLVVNHCRKIPYGKTISYGELAGKAGSPLAARAVGNVMRNNRVPLIVPCHRVVASGGKIGGFSAPTGLDLKRKLLSLEAELVTA